MAKLRCWLSLFLASATLAVSLPGLGAPPPRGKGGADLVISATGEGPELSDIPSTGFVYEQDPFEGEPSPAAAILDLLGSPREILSLPAQALEVEFGGRVPYAPDLRDGADGADGN